MARILIIGGTTFMGYQLVWRLIARGDQVTLLNRGRHPDPFADQVERLKVDRTTPEFESVLQNRSFDAAVDFAAFTADDAKGAVRSLQDLVGHYIFISSGAAYLAGRGVEIPLVRPFSEADYPQETAAPPSDPDDLPSWRYGAEKRAAEAVLETAWNEHQFPATRLRLPIVNGERDPGRRMEGYLWRILDGGPVLLPEGGEHLTRHVYAGDVVTAVAGFMGRADTFGEAYNLSQDEEPTLAELVSLLARLAGAPDRSLAVSEPELAAAGLQVRDISPFSGRWASRINPARAKAELGFRHQPLEQYLEKMVSALLNNWNSEPPKPYRLTRALEKGLASGARD